jgi:hypothetical protein
LIEDKMLFARLREELHGTKLKRIRDREKEIMQRGG